MSGERWCEVLVDVNSKTPTDGGGVITTDMLPLPCGALIVEVSMPCPDNIAGCAVYHFKYVCESGHPVAAEVVA